MIKNWLVRGDCHGNFAWMTNGCLNNYTPEETAIIILGDAGINFWLNKTDKYVKRNIENKGYTFYIVKGNHEARPETLPNIRTIFDENLNQYILIEEEYPHIRYFNQYGFYKIGNYNCLILGGAYSVDKWYRLARVGLTEKTNIPTKSLWFADEQMTKHEMQECEQNIINNYGPEIDFIFSHTCPYSLQPTDMFLSGIDQSKVDNSMELWMEKIYQKYRGKFIAWLWGHFHRDSIEAPHCEMLYNDIENLDDIVARWKKYDETGELDWWLVKSPYFEERK